MNEIIEKSEKIPFKRYYNTLTDSEKKNIRWKLIPDYTSESNFFLNLRNSSFNKLMQEKIESVTGIEFDWSLNEEEND